MATLDLRTGLAEFTLNGTHFYVEGELSHTRDYKWEEVRIYKRWIDVVGYGKYKWLNRPWQRFRFSSALIDAFVSFLGEQARSLIKEAVDKSYDCEQAVKYFIEHWTKEEKKDDVQIQESYKEYDNWEEADIELHKNTDWESRNWEELDAGDEFKGEVYIYRWGKEPEVKEATFHKFIRPNAIYSPYYRAIDIDTSELVGPMYDGRKHNKYDIHDRYEDQKIYDVLSEGKEPVKESEYKGNAKVIKSVDELPKVGEPYGYKNDFVIKVNKKKDKNGKTIYDVVSQEKEARDKKLGDEVDVAHYSFIVGESLKESEESDKITEIIKGLRELFKDRYDVYRDFKQKNRIVVDVIDGDWKHDHLFVELKGKEYINKLGYDVDVDEEVIEEDGSDTYSSMHFFEIKDDKLEEKIETTQKIDKSLLSKVTDSISEDGTYSVEEKEDKTLDTKKEELTDGYSVSFFRPEITDEDIKKCLDVIGDKLGEKYVGIYEGSEEISYCIKDINKAKKFAEIFNQVSIWDNSKGEEIPNDKYDENKKVDYQKAIEELKGLLNESLKESCSDKELVDLLVANGSCATKKEAQIRVKRMSQEDKDKLCKSIKQQSKQSLLKDSLKEEVDKNLTNKIEEVLDNYGITYGDIVEDDKIITIIGIDEEEQEETINALNTELKLNVSVSDDNDLIIKKDSLKEKSLNESMKSEVTKWWQDVEDANIDMKWGFHIDNGDYDDIESMHSAMFDMLIDLKEKEDAKELFNRGKRIYNKYAKSPLLLKFEESLKEEVEETKTDKKIFGYINNGKLSDLDVEEFVNKTKERGSLHTNRLVKDEDDEKILYHIVVSPMREDEIWLDIVKLTFTRKKGESADDIESYKFDETQERVLTKDFSTYEEVIEEIKKFKEEHLED